MTRKSILLLISLTCFVFWCSNASGQAFAGHLQYNATLFHQQQLHHTVAQKTTAVEPISLPFFEDFTTSSLYPDELKWTDYHVYINNTMGYKPVSRGVATFDALDWRGIPYDSFSNTNFRYADTLTSQPINLSVNTVVPGDSVYLSFFYQPQGNGFYPISQDSLMLFFKTRFGGYKKVWSAEGTTLRPFKQVMIPISDSLYFDSFFQFRFINIAAQYWADAVWNVDYVRVDKNRSLIDTMINDIGFTSDPTFMLNDYTSIPYRQFFANPAGERAAVYVCSLGNNYTFPQTITNGYTATALNTGTLLKPISWSSLSAPALNVSPLVFPSYVSLLPLSSLGYHERVVFQNKFYFQSVNTSDPPDNDTVVRNQIFDNYLAYDDGSAEKSFYLSLYPTLPGRISVEHHLNRPDTLRGMAIYFGRQIPFSFNKPFSIQIYSSLAGVNGAASDNLIYEQDPCYPGYVDTLNHFWIYKFDRPIPMPAGVFFAGTFQPAQSGSDSLFFGLDVNRIGSNHTYINVLSGWEPSLVSGAVMMRPLLGQEIAGTKITDILTETAKWKLYPNPAKDELNIEIEGDAVEYYLITDISGRVYGKGKFDKETKINISTYPPGMYFVRLIGDVEVYQTLKFIKQ